MVEKECRELKIVLRIYFCRHRDERICRKANIDMRNYSWITYEFSILDYKNIDEIVEYVIDDLRERYRATRLDPSSADRWAEKIYPFIYETVSDAVSTFINDLFKSMEECREVEQPSYVEPEYSTTYPSLFSEIELPERIDKCDKILKCRDYWMQKLEGYYKLVYGALQYVLTKLDPDLYQVVAYISAFLSPHERVLRNYGLTKYFYEVYYHS